MKPRRHDPSALDVAAFAAEAGVLAGRWPLAGFERLAGAAHEDARPAPDGAVEWSLRGESRPQRNGPPQVWLHLHGEATLNLVCQRCLAPVAERLVAARSFLFVDGEARAEELDAELEDDVLALTRRLDARTLLEDELLLAIPLVPRHARCALPGAAGAAGSEAARANPFEALRALRRGPPDGPEDT